MLYSWLQHQLNPGSRSPSGRGQRTPNCHKNIHGCGVVNLVNLVNMVNWLGQLVNLFISRHMTGVRHQLNHMQAALIG